MNIFSLIGILGIGVSLVLTNVVNLSQEKAIAELQRQVSELEKLPNIEDMQRRLGCENIDGTLGPETQTKWDEAVNAELFNSYAAPYFANEIYSGSCENEDR